MKVIHNLLRQKQNTPSVDSEIVGLNFVFILSKHTLTAYFILFKKSSGSYLKQYYVK